MRSQTSSQQEATARIHPETDEILSPAPRGLPVTGRRSGSAEGLGSTEGLEETRAMMLQLASGQRFERLGAIVQEHLLTGGKRLRARLALAAVEALGGEREQATAWAAACELLHNATLVHDDLQDGDEVRRGQLTVWARHGQAQAINAGDLLLMLPFIAVEHIPVSDACRWQLARAIARRAEETVRGQASEMSLLATGRLDSASYQEAAMGKTSALFALPIHGAALMTEIPPERAEALGDCFRRVGLLFQIQDDVLDLFGDKGRGQVGCDIREGGVSALVAEHVRLHPSEREWLVAILRTSRDETCESDVEAVIRRFRKGGALDAVLEQIRRLEEEIMTSSVLREEPRLHLLAIQLVGLSLDPIRHLLTPGGAR